MKRIYLINIKIEHFKLANKFIATYFNCYPISSDNEYSEYYIVFDTHLKYSAMEYYNSEKAKEIRSSIEYESHNFYEWLKTIDKYDEFMMNINSKKLGLL